VGVPKEPRDIQSKGYLSGSCRDSRKSSCSGKGCCTVLEQDGISAKAPAVDSFPKLRRSTSFEDQGDRQYEPKADQISDVRNLARGTIDVEKGPSLFEHVILSVQGMTCTGCETKLFKSLSSIPSITKLQTSLVLSRTEFDIDTTVISLDDVLM
jgi:copper chaperone CopZ